MKVNFSNYSMLKHRGSGLSSEPGNFREKNNVGMHGIDNRGYNAEYCGSFTGKSEAATSFMDLIVKSSWFEHFAKYANDHNISTSALIALVLAGVLRPATIMTLPGKKDREDKIYASGHAMASGIIGFLVSTAITSPFDESIKKVFNKDNLSNNKMVRGNFKKMNERIKELEAAEKLNQLTEATKKELKNLTKKRKAMDTLMHNAPDWIIGIPRAILTIALIPPILKYVFGIEKKKKRRPEEMMIANSTAPQQNLQNSNINELAGFIKEKPVFSAFRGGVQ